jgi:hypothetical protein
VWFVWFAVKNSLRLDAFALNRLACLTRHYGFTAEQLDFVINYDIKYRLGRDGGEEE